MGNYTSTITNKDYQIFKIGCDTWGLPRSMGSCISSFLTNKFKTQHEKYKVWSYTDVGLILISESYICEKNRSLYVANPVSQDCVQIPSHAYLRKCSWPLGIVSRTDENGVLLGYKVVVEHYVRHASNPCWKLIFCST